MKIRDWALGALAIVGPGAVGFWHCRQIGRDGLSWVFLGTIPLALVCLGIGWLRTSRRDREIADNLTRAERRRAMKMAGDFGARCGAILAFGTAPGVLALSFLISTCPAQPLAGFLALVAAVSFAGMPLFMLPTLRRHRREMREYMDATKHARQTAEPN